MILNEHGDGQDRFACFVVVKLTTAIVYAGSGEKEQAFQSLEQAYAAHDAYMQYLKVERHHDSQRSGSRFADLGSVLDCPSD